MGSTPTPVYMVKNVSFVEKQYSQKSLVFYKTFLFFPKMKREKKERSYKKQEIVYKIALGGCLGRTIKDVPCNEKLRRGAILFGGPSNP